MVVQVVEEIGDERAVFVTQQLFHTPEEVGGLLITELLFAQQFLETSSDSRLQPSQDSSLEVVARCGRNSSIGDDVGDLEEDVRREQGRGISEFGEAG